MKKPLMFLFALACTSVFQPAFAQEGVYLQAADGVKVYADYYTPASPKGAIILLNGAPLDPLVPPRNRCEYGSFPQKLQDQGYAVLNVDLRISSDGQNCQTHTHAPVADAYDAMQDLAAAVQWMQAKTGQQKVLLFGNGFSSMMSIFYALQHPEQVQGVVAFAPGSSSIDMTGEVAANLKNLSVPLVMITPADEKGLAEAILEGLPDQRGQVVLAPELDGYTLGFNDPRTLEVYQKASFDFLQQLNP
ncbi:alpha/beta hydrolase [Deinococcus roseus]|uniref:Serine aminopeptidase S33 domain-containing protein n=1 Tax=Deinococcus roseus TaxID=392414 RepID=A0ABQ2CU23_9DEIO|nr:alpha/beta fold hydrolase [Deinococcus roseus]GGJ19521.1 hypothetical protein GCM10008938_02030 [Deinococcus roseus]